MNLSHGSTLLTTHIDLPFARGLDIHLQPQAFTSSFKLRRQVHLHIVLEEIALPHSISC